MVTFSIGESDEYKSYALKSLRIEISFELLKSENEESENLPEERERL
jgi:hypothetical protein